MNKRHAGHSGWKYHKAITEGPPEEDGYELKAPYRLRKPAVIAVQLMGDLFREGVDAGYIQDVFYVMEYSPKHRFIVLTKRPERMEFYADRFRWPSRKTQNVWWGASIWDQSSADEFLPSLMRLKQKGWRTILSVEPMLGAVNLAEHSPGPDWLIVGAETGPGKRPMPMAAFRDLRAQCKTLGIPFFGKVGNHGEPLGPRQFPGRSDE